MLNITIIIIMKLKEDGCVIQEAKAIEEKCKI